MRYLLSFIILVCAFSLSAQSYSSFEDDYLELSSSKKRAEYVNALLSDLPDESMIELSDSVSVLNMERLLTVVSKRDLKKVDKMLLQEYQSLYDLYLGQMEALTFSNKLNALPIFFSEEDVAYIEMLLKEYSGLPQNVREFVGEDAARFLWRAENYVCVIDKHRILIEDIRALGLNSLGDLERCEKLSFRYDLLSDGELEFIPYDVRRKMIVEQSKYDKLTAVVMELDLLPQLESLEIAGVHKVMEVYDVYDALSIVEKGVLGDSVSDRFAMYREMCEEVYADTATVDSVGVLSVLLENPLTLYFGYEDVIYGPTNSELIVLLRYIKVLKENPTAILRVKGYAVRSGNIKESQHHAYERAMSVKAQMELYDANSEQIEVVYELVEFSDLFEDEWNILRKYRTVEFDAQIEVP